MTQKRVCFEYFMVYVFVAVCLTVTSAIMGPLRYDLWGVFFLLPAFLLSLFQYILLKMRIEQISNTILWITLLIDIICVSVQIGKISSICAAGNFFEFALHPLGPMFFLFELLLLWRFICTVSCVVCYNIKSTDRNNRMVKLIRSRAWTIGWAVLGFLFLLATIFFYVAYKEPTEWWQF